MRERERFNTVFFEIISKNEPLIIELIDSQSCFGVSDFESFRWQAENGD